MAVRKLTKALSDVWENSRVDESIHILPRINTCLPVSDRISVNDSFSSGPCDGDPVQHALMRAAYWRSASRLFVPERPSQLSKRRRKSEDSGWRPIVWTTGSDTSRECGGADDICLALANFSESKPVVVWTTRHWSDRLALWWSLESIHRTQRDISRFTVATVRSPWASHDRRQADPFPISCVPAARLRKAFDDRVPLTGQFLETGSNLWSRFADPSPLAFDEARRNGCVEFPELLSGAETLGLLYPRYSADGIAVRLSLLDEALLEGFPVDEWLTPAEVTHVASRARSLLDEFGGNLSIIRWDQWTKHQAGDLLLESRPESTNTNSYTGVRYRLTPRGRRILDEGLLAPDDAPPIFAGGCEVYRREPFWVRFERAGDWWLEQR